MGRRMGKINLHCLSAADEENLQSCMAATEATVSTVATPSFSTEADIGSM